MDDAAAERIRKARGKKVRPACPCFSFPVFMMCFRRTTSLGGPPWQPDRTRAVVRRTREAASRAGTIAAAASRAGQVEEPNKQSNAVLETHGFRFL